VDPTHPETDRAREVLTAVADSLDRSLTAWRSTATEPTDEGYLYGYELELADAEGHAERRLVFVEDSIRDGSYRGVFRIPAHGTDAAVTVWVYPDDPGLAPLRSLVEPRSVSKTLERLGIALEVVSTEVISYRPTRRAVVRADTPTGHVYLKVVEADKAAAIAERHKYFRSSALPVPRVLGWSPDGIVVLSELFGVEAQSVVSQIEKQDAFLDQIEFLTSLLADVPAFNTARASLFERVDWYVERLVSRMPDHRDRITRLGEEIVRCGSEGRRYDFRPVTVHGDLHLGQLFVDPQNPSSVTGVLDIDTAGAGDPADDAAAFYAHLIALSEVTAASDPAYSEASGQLAERWRDRWRHNRPAGFAKRARAIAATHLLGHALRPLSSDANGLSLRLIARAEAVVADR
jgi:hypothetical protein